MNHQNILYHEYETKKSHKNAVILNKLNEFGCYLSFIPSEGLGWAGRHSIPSSGAGRRSVMAGYACLSVLKLEST